MESLGGPHTPAVGWAAGIERLGMLIEAPETEIVIAVIPDTPASEANAAKMTAAVRALGLPVVRPFKGNSKRQGELARKAGVNAILYIRDDPDYREHLHTYPIDLARPGGAEVHRIIMQAAKLVGLGHPE
jgi:histidyl-tRNA synthetase